MKVLLTGAFGNIGTYTLEEMTRRGWTVRCFDLPTSANQKAARRWGSQVEFAWGDLRNPADVAAAAQGVDAAVHLGYIIPRQSYTGINSEDQPDLARDVNVGGTRNLIEGLRAAGGQARLLFTSSLHVFGRTHHRQPPLRVEDPAEPIEHYAKHKLECEGMVRESGLKWAIFRLPATLPIRLILDPFMFQIPLVNRIEYAHGRDVALALTNGVASDSIWEKTLLIGGGPRCQLIYGDMVQRILETVGVGMLPESAFGQVPYPVDWLETSESQRLLNYQQRTLDDYLGDLNDLLGWRRPFIRAFRPLVRSWLLRAAASVNG